MSSVVAAASAMVEIVIAAPAMLTVDPSGMEIEYVSSSRFSFLQSSMLTGILAAELLVKNAVIKLSFKQVNTSGYGFLRTHINVTSGLMIKATTAILPTRTAISFPYSTSAPSPCSEMVPKIRPMIPKGAQLITHCTATETASEISSRAFFVPGPAFLRATPKMMAHARMPM